MCRPTWARLKPRPPSIGTFRDPGYCGDDYSTNNTVVPLSDDKVALRAHIDGLEGYGATAGALGTAWSWYMLSPNWTSLWTGDSQPGPYSELTEIVDGAPKLRKIAVLMTDGLYNTYRGWKDYDSAVVSQNAKDICTAMKAANIEIYTVGFDLDSIPDEAGRDRAYSVLTHCGTDLDHFYNALTAVQLKQAFRSIAMEMSKLHLTR